MSAADQVDYDEFGLFHENAAEYGLPFDEPPTGDMPLELASTIAQFIP